MANSRKNKRHKKTHRFRQVGNGARGPYLLRYDQQLLQMESPRGHLAPPPASRKDRLGEVQAAVNLSCVYSLQEEGCPLMLI